MEKRKNNFINLTNLWAIVSKPFNGYASDDTISYSQIHGSEWPNKIWTNTELNNDILQNIKFLIKNSQINMRFVDIEYEGRNNSKLIEKAGFKLTSSLPGMHLVLTKPFEVNLRLKFKMVTEITEAKTWCTIFEKSFGYVISEDLVLKNMNKLHFYIAFDDEEPVGVIKLHFTNGVVGIYSLGVPNNYRGRGYAKSIMLFALNKALHQGATLATLQASKLAQGMYERLGFKTDFMMNNYELKKQ